MINMKICMLVKKFKVELFNNKVQQFLINKYFIFYVYNKKKYF
jgi:hypothetical protein